jgi:hypothetical protein
MAAPTPPADTLLTDAAGAQSRAGDLWAAGPVLVVALRRPGCLLCREQAVHLWAERARFAAAGVSLACVLHEWRAAEVEAFAPTYWGGPLFYDEAKAFHAAVHGGRLRRGNVLDLLNPFSAAWRAIRRAKEAGRVTDSNLVGDGLTLGGVLVIAKGGAVVAAFPETTFGDHAPLEELVAAAEKAAKASAPA